ncbi:MAG: glycosyltransferase family 2 protein [Gemmataceae bacterium]
MPPLLSIGIPTYNRVGLLKEAIDSVLRQTRISDVELIISDDGSKDGTDAMVAQYGDQVRYIRQEKNLGLAGNHRFLPGVATGKYFAYFQDDDRLTADYAARVIEALEAVPDAGGYLAFVVAGPSPECLSTLPMIGPPVPFDWATGTPQRLPGELFVALAMMNTPAILPACAGRTDRVRHAVNTWPAGITLHFDRAFAASFAATGDMLVDPRAIAFNRFHPNQVHRKNFALHTAKNNADLQLLIGYLDTLAKDWPADWFTPHVDTLRTAQAVIVDWDHDYERWPSDGESRLAKDLRGILRGPTRPGVTDQTKAALRALTPPVVWSAARRLAGVR